MRDASCRSSDTATRHGYSWHHMSRSPALKKRAAHLRQHEPQGGVSIPVAAWRVPSPACQFKEQSSWRYGLSDGSLSPCRTLHARPAVPRQSVLGQRDVSRRIFIRAKAKARSTASAAFTRVVWSLKKSRAGALVPLRLELRRIRSQSTGATGTHLTFMCEKRTAESGQNKARRRPHACETGPCCFPRTSPLPCKAKGHGPSLEFKATVRVLSVAQVPNNSSS
ncbi:hypothetical protein EDB81DRAFT_37992 [Dactylonectria macrodidyma]|uniref:Uncharacterized protein n=1 Tax=Dactylonectria macrodidyma TaxID=307937 RepID=A0A9P9FVU0_9HYPO|nr:hypothetical protein EDB81DRAFT_37992 [Dactylonectria macrodidyma]